jgi:hypothetical protein
MNAELSLLIKVGKEVLHLTDLDLVAECQRCLVTLGNELGHYSPRLRISDCA